MKNCTISSIFVFAFVFAFSSINFFSQTTAPKDAPVLKDETSSGGAAENFTIGDVKGLVNAKAVYLAKPVFPMGAREAGAEGAVRVEITIDEEGNVISAAAVSGHQLLKAAAEDAARRTIFRITRDAGGNPVKTSGILVYNFAVQKSGWAKIGYDLASLEKVRLLPIQIPVIAKALPPEWTSEREMLAQLEEISRREPPTPPPGLIRAEPPLQLTRDRMNLPNGTTAKSATSEYRLILPAPPTAEQISVSQNLITALQSRLGSDEKSLWQFDLGVKLSRALQLYRNPNESANAAQITKQAAENAPPSVSPEVIAELQKLTTIFEREKRTIDTRNEIGKSLTLILNGK